MTTNEQPVQFAPDQSVRGRPVHKDVGSAARRDGALTAGPGEGVQHRGMEAQSARTVTLATVQVTVTLVTLLVPTVPLAFVTAQLCPEGCVFTVTA